MASGKKDILLGMVRNGLPMTLGQQIRLTILLSLPAIAAQFSSVLMQYIDAGMVGQLGANQSASIGLVATTTWIMGGSSPEPARDSQSRSPTFAERRISREPEL